MKLIRPKLATIVVASLLAPLVIGFWFHTSRNSPPVLGKYSTRYFLGVCLLTVAAILLS